MYFLSQGTQSFGLFRPDNERHIPRRLLDRFDGILRGECTRRGGAAAARVSSAPSVIQSITEYCRILQNITEYCRVLQSVTECQRVSQSITECYRALQSITEYTEFNRILQSITEYS